LWWKTTSGLIIALMNGNGADVLVGLYIVVPFALASVASIAGLMEDVASTRSASVPERS
jgi:hypothetical protein